MSMHKGILGQQFGGATVRQDQTLGEYIHRKRRAAAFDTVAQEYNPNYVPDYERLYQWLRLNVLTDSQLDIVPPWETKSIRFL